LQYFGFLAAMAARYGVFFCCHRVMVGCLFRGCTGVFGGFRACQNCSTRMFHVLGGCPGHFAGMSKTHPECVSVAVALQPVDVRWLQGEKITRLRRQKNRVDVLKRTDTAYCQRVELKVVVLVANAKVLVPRVDVVALTRTPVTATGKTTHNGFVEIQLVQLIPGR